MLDEIKNEDIPVEKVAWWVDINEKQCISGYEFTDPTQLIDIIANSLGIKTHEDRMDKIICRYNELYHAGRITEANAFLAEYLHGVSLLGKAQLVSAILCGGFENANLASSAKNIEGRLSKPLFTHIKQPVDHFYQCKQITLQNDVFTIATDFVFHRGSKGDAYVIWIWRNAELIHTIGGLVEVDSLRVFWDSFDNIIYIAYTSEMEIMEDRVVVDSRTMLSITTVENPNTQAICSNFKYII